MPAAESHLRVRKADGITTVEFVDRNILDEANIAKIRDELTGLIDADTDPKLLICFSNVDHLASAALGMLITIHNRLKAKNGQLRLSDIDPQIHEVFVITKLNKLFQIHESRDQAVKSF